MALITGSWGFDAIALMSALIAVVIAYLKWSFSYWEKRGVKTLPTKLPFGNANDLFLQRSSVGEAFQKTYQKFKDMGLKHAGFYFAARPIYVPIDPEIIKHMLQIDFQHFVNHGVYFNEKDDPLSAHLFSLEDAKWRNLRVKLTPTFTSGRLKAMFQTLVDCTEGLTALMDESSNGKALDIKDILARFTTDIIGSCAFGIECNSLKDPDAEFRKYGRRVFELDLMESLRQMIQLAFSRSFLNKIGLRVFRSDVTRFFTKAIRETVEYREKNNVHRKDFIHLLLQLKNRGKLSDDDDEIFGDGETKNEVTLTMEELSAQAFVFFLAGFETSSTTMTWALYELASNPKVQEKLRYEINTVLAKHDNKITYDALTEMVYMDKVVNETLRKYPPVGLLARICNKDYRVPGTDFRMKTGTQVFIPVFGLHRDPEYYPNPDAFVPERFDEENKNKRPPFTFLPFGDGPRACIGLRFGLMQTKVGLTALLKNYEVTVSKKTETPIKFDPMSFILAAKGGIWLNVKKL